jgi:hypothetical protein
MSEKHINEKHSLCYEVVLQGLIRLAYQILNAVPTYSLKLIASSICSTLSVCWQKHVLLSKEQNKMYAREYETADLTILNNV